MVLYDLPQATARDRRRYTKFRGELKKMGYLMLQESVYIKHVRNTGNIAAEKDKIRAIAPAEGNLLLLPLTIKQFLAIEQLSGKAIPFKDYCSSVLIL